MARSGDCRSRVPVPGAHSQFPPARGSRSWRALLAQWRCQEGKPLPPARLVRGQGGDGASRDTRCPRLGRRDGDRLAGYRPAPAGRGHPAAASGTPRTGILDASPAPGACSDPGTARAANNGPRPPPGCPGRHTVGLLRARPAAPGPPRRSAAAAPRPSRLGRPSPLNFPRALATSGPRRAAAVRTAPRPSRQVPHKHSLPSEPPKSPQTARPGTPGRAPEKSPLPPPLLSRSHLAQLPPSLARPPASPASPPRSLCPPRPGPRTPIPGRCPFPRARAGQRLRCRRLPALGPRRPLRATSRRRREAPPQRSEAAGGGGYTHARPLRPDAVSPRLASGAAPVREERSGAAAAALRLPPWAAARGAAR